MIYFSYYRLILIGCQGLRANEKGGHPLKGVSREKTSLP
jgi:hypothetical protein